MIIYRYEYPDGGGPFLTRDGASRTDPDIIFDDNTLYGCDTIEHLKEWFEVHHITLPKEIQLCKYYSDDIIHEYPNTGEIIIRKDTARLLSKIKNK